MRTQVGIIGAGPAGLLLAHLLHLRGVESVVLESRDRAYVERRQRAGILEQGTIDVLRDSGLGERLDRQGLAHHGIELRFAGAGHRVDMTGLTGGRTVAVYAQTEVVKDLIAARPAAGPPLLFEAEAVGIGGIDTERPTVTYVAGGERGTLECDYVAGCDGFRGVSRASVPATALRTFERVYPYGWLGILADVAPSCEELIYANHERGFALHSMRSRSVSRLYVQVDAGESVGNWSDDRVWSELRARFATHDGWELKDGPVLEKGITPMRSFVAEPMRHGRLFLAGDAAHIVPPTGAKGLNLAVSDVVVLAEALAARYASGDEGRLDGYSDRCLRRVWRAEYFSYWMTTMLHRAPSDDDFAHRLQLAQLAYTAGSRAASTALAENYTGWPF